jgi:diguanylate cyclase (GGDEF)-like protein
MNLSFAPAVRQIVLSTLLVFILVLIVGALWLHDESFWRLASWMGVSLGCAALFAIWRSARVIRPFDNSVQALVKAMGQLARGERVAVMAIQHPKDLPALVPLVTEFNAMAQAVQTTLGNTRNELAHQRALDPLTGVANRAALETQLDHSMGVARDGGQHAALVYLDVDRFKLVNEALDTLGGDELLRQLAARLTDAIDPRASVGRVAADEFVVILQDRSLDAAIASAEVLRNAIRAVPFETRERPVTLTISAGVLPITREFLELLGHYSGAAASPGDLLTAGAAACQTAKEMGADRVYAVRDRASAERTRLTTSSWLKRIHGALAQQQFRLVYQPIRSLDPTKAKPHARYEVLLRMLDRDGRYGMPGNFISVAERYDLMQALDRWVINQAIADWRKVAARGPNWPVFSINLSGHSLSSESFMRELERTIVECGIPPEAICFELTETAAIANPERAREIIERLRQRGNKFWLDDFGAGLSSFNYIKHFPVDGIKIDGLFVRGITKTYLDYALTEAITRVAKALGLGTVAEYVESEEIAQKLRGLGIEYGQGYWIGRPLTWEETFEPATNTTRLTPLKS